ncbi:MAG: transketolase [Deltaproteobacteria bacterium]|nr:transketolase [Deltaproteobacteria bacterium]
MDSNEARELNEICREVRTLTMDAIGRVGVGHVGGSLSIVDALVVLYHRHMRVDPQNPRKEGRDRFVLSKGHAGPALYAVLAGKGYFDKSLLATLNQPETRLPSHCDMNLTPGVDMTAGSLGQGISCAVGIALGARIRKDGARVYCVIGDGESQEGQVWEAAMYAAHMKLDRLIVFTDYNGQQLDAPIEEINSLEPLVDKWRAFGWNVIDVPDGHDVAAIDAAIVRAKTCREKPSMILLHTIKGKGVSFAVAAGATPTTSNHNMAVSKEQWRQALEELKGEGGHG